MSYRISRRTRRYSIPLALMAVITITAACSDNNEEGLAGNTSTGGYSSPVSQSPEITADSPQQALNKRITEQSPAISDTVEDRKQGSGRLSNAASESSVSQKDALEAWLSSPSLKGISLGDSRSSVIKQYGSPDESYTLNERKSQVEVYDYEGFTVGFSDDGVVHFVEVYGEGLQTGIAKLLIGDEGDKAKKTLGTPHSSTKYVLSYTADQTMLKLDLEPDTSRIVSMKLFPYSE
ncbi:hypothetical protein DNH61_11185 [Paenibacillus sambharensis]|uniref:DUF4309 domain-containing protein n=1 Tax=Paenibacillus sambharensis TaxID=1803190 RepID=A0A2W1LWV4_9BACL|nr:hypothetical protein [Paenibacillus sambharensis]PZD95987.1 hypothetical protein DNH61_11185 [Paenibacillus sambharensis]